MITSVNQLDIVRKSAFDLMRSDAIFILSLFELGKGCPELDSNYICMCLPYMGLFADGAAQWCGKVGMSTPVFSKEEKDFYKALRLSVKAFEYSFIDYKNKVTEVLKQSDEHFRSVSSDERYYYNIGADIYCGQYCGNTILCSSYIPGYDFSDKGIGPRLKQYSVVCGKLIKALGVNYDNEYNHNYVKSAYKDYHLYRQAPFRMQNNDALVLFCILCTINYLTVFIEQCFTDEIPQKFKFAYLQYYYLCDFLPMINLESGEILMMDDSMKNRDLRNCLAHYGLGAYMKEEDIDTADLLAGLTKKSLDKTYYEAKEEVYRNLNDVAEQIKALLF